MIKRKILIGLVLLSIIALLAGACAQPVPAPAPAPSPAPIPTPAPTPTPVPTPSGSVEVYVTDAPPRDEVSGIWVTVSEVRIHKAVAEREREQASGDNQTQQQQQTQQGEDGWIAISLSDNATTFNLLEIKGIEQFLGASEVEASKYTQVRLVIDRVEVSLGTGAPQAATVPSDELRISHPFDVVAGEATVILLDFDADKMVTVTGAGKIMVKPVIKLTVRAGKATGQKGQQNGPPTKKTEEASIEVACDDFYQQKHITRELEVAVGDTFKVILCSNPTTGFLWSESAQIGDPTVVEQTEHEFITPESETPPPVGTPGQEIWTFKALKEGTSTISLEYSRPWEGGEKGEWLFDMTVVVK